MDRPGYPHMSQPAPASAAPALFDDEFLRKLGQIDLVARKLFRGLLRGEHTTPRRGRGLEFADFRRYGAGDDFRHIDWNIFSRLDRLFVKLYASEEDISLHVLIDASASMDFGEPRKFDHARRIAAALACIGLNNLDRVSLSAFAAELGASLPGLRTRRHVPALLAFLRDLPCAGATHYAPALRDFAARARGPAVVVLISDLLAGDDLEAGIDALRARGHDVAIVQLLAEEEIAPALDGALRLVDAEDGSALAVSVDASLRAAYQRRLARRLANIESYCLRRGVEYLRASTAIAFEDVVLKYLRQGSLLT